MKQTRRAPTTGRGWSRRSGPGLLLAAAIAIAACAPAATPAASAASAATAKVAGAKPTTPEEIARYQGTDRQQILEEGARKEGKLSWYTSLAGPIVDSLANDFKRKYPFIQVDVFRGAENELLTRATQEAQAGQQVFDAIESPPTTIHLLADAKLLVPYHSPFLKNLPDSLKSGASGATVLSATVRVSYIGFGYNTTLIPAADVPKTLGDLLNPKLAGKMALAGSTTGKRWVGSVLRAMGEEKGKQFLSQLASQQKPKVQQISGKALMDLVAKGEFPASPTIFRDHVLQLAGQQGSPVKWIPLDPVVGNAGQGALAAKAPHPHAALLFVDYLFTDGQKILEENFYSVPTTPVSFQAWVPEEGRTTSQIEGDVARWEAVFGSTFR